MPHPRKQVELLIILTGLLLYGCAQMITPPSLPPETFRNDSGPKLVRVSLYGNAPDIVLLHPVLSGDSLIGTVPTAGLIVQVNIHVVRADSTGRMAIPIADIRRIVAEQSDQSKANKNLLLIGLGVVALVVVLIEFHPMRNSP